MIPRNLSPALADSNLLPSASDVYNPPVPVTLGSERLLASNELVGKRVGLVANPASVGADFQHITDRLAQQPNVTLAALFGPQHGYHADAQENMVETPHARHSRVDVPIYSLYSETREPTAEMLDGLDVLVIDLQDVGTRIYTYVHTMTIVFGLGHATRYVWLCAIGRTRSAVTRSRARSCNRVANRSSGSSPIPIRHGMTIGELARLFNEHFHIGADLDVVSLEGWSRRMCQDDTGCPWIMPSPNLPTLDSTIVYPGGVLLEGTNLSEGRGTTRPFELVGAPWIDADKVATRLNAQSLSGVHFRPVTFEPTFHKHARRPCGGCQIHVTDRRTFRPVPHRRGGHQRVPTCGSRHIRMARPAVRIRARETPDRHSVWFRPTPDTNRGRHASSRNRSNLGGRGDTF